MALVYTQLVLEHFHNPRNVGEIDCPDADAMIGSPACGDMLSMSMKIKDDIICDAKFRSYGCASSIATGSMVTEMVKGKTIEEAEQITWKGVIEELGGLPPVKVHCSILAIDTLQAALKKLRIERGEREPEVLPLTSRNVRNCISDVAHGGIGDTLGELELVNRIKVDKETQDIFIFLNMESEDPFFVNMQEEIKEHIEQQWKADMYNKVIFISLNEVS
jgi:nitrogen fixation protein NifU and related proteins